MIFEYLHLISYFFIFCHEYKNEGPYVVLQNAMEFLYASTKFGHSGFSRVKDLTEKQRSLTILYI